MTNNHQELSFGERLDNWRWTQHLTIIGLARKLGVAHNTVWGWLRLGRTPIKVYREKLQAMGFPG